MMTNIDDLQKKEKELGLLLLVFVGLLVLLGLFLVGIFVSMLGETAPSPQQSGMLLDVARMTILAA